MRQLGTWGWRQRERRRGRKGEKKIRKENMKEQGDQDADGGGQRENKERDDLIEGAIMETVRNPLVKIFPEIHKGDCI